MSTGFCAARKIPGYCIQLTNPSVVNTIIIEKNLVQLSLQKLEPWKCVMIIFLENCIHRTVIALENECKCDKVETTCTQIDKFNKQTFSIHLSIFCLLKMHYFRDYTSGSPFQFTSALPVTAK